MRPARLIEHSFFVAAVVSGLVTLAVLVFMVFLGLPVFSSGQIGALVSGPWLPDRGLFGIHSMIIGSLAIAGAAVVFAFPVSLGCSAFIFCLGPRPAAKVLQQIIRLMAGIPTVVYGFVGIFLLVPILRRSFGGSGMTILTAALLLAVLISPTMIFVFTDSFARVPRSYLTAVDALGGTKVQRLVYVVLPYARPGIVTGLLLGLGRAVGDTMISLMVAGNSVGLPHSLLNSARTLTAHIGLVIAADFDSLEFRVIFVCGLLLYLFTACLVVVIRFAVSKGRR